MNPLQPLSNVFNDIVGLERVLKLAQNVSLIATNLVSLPGWQIWGWLGGSDGGTTKGTEVLDVMQRAEVARGHFVLGEFRSVLLSEL